MAALHSSVQKRDVQGTPEAVPQRLLDLAECVARVRELMRMRVEIARGRQHQDLLASMKCHTRPQLRPRLQSGPSKVFRWQPLPTK